MLPFRFPILLAALLLLSRLAPADAPTEIYRWDAIHWLTSYNKSQFTASALTNPDGSAGAHIEVSARDALNPYNHIMVSAANLKSGGEYTALLTCSVTTPTVYPTSFYLFARNSAGNQYDIWQTFIGLPGLARTIPLHMDLKDIPGGKWMLYFGISRQGGLDVNSLVVYSGATSDGKTTYASTPTTPNGTPASDVPATLKPATGFQTFTLAPPQNTKGPVISASTYGLVADAPGASPDVAVANAAALQKAIGDAKTQNASRLVLPPGTYRVAAPTALAFSGLNDITVDGQNARLIFEKLTKDGPAILIVNCTRMVIENLFLDWDNDAKPISSLAVISNVSPDKLQCDFTFPGFDQAHTEATQKAQWRAIFPMDPASLVTTGTLHYTMTKGTTITAGSTPSVLHMTSPLPLPFQEGGSYCVRHLYYEMAGFKVAGDKDLLFKHCTIYAIPGMGWFFNGAMQNFELSDCHIDRPSGSREPLTTAADGFHVDQSSGNFIVENCSITGTGDDEMNIHSESYQGNVVRDSSDPAKVALENCPSYQLRIAPGDKVEFFNADFSNLDGSATPVTREVASVNSSIKSNRPETTVTFTSPVPDGITAVSILQNARLDTRNVLITGCDVHDSNGRGVLLSSQGGTISRCHFRNVFGPPIDLESEIVEPLWSEGRGASNILIKDNIFQESNGAGRYRSAFIGTNAHFPYGPSTATLYDQITIEGNRFINCPGAAVFLSNASNVIVRDNEIHTTKDVPLATRYANTLFFINATHLALGGNKWINEIAGAPAGGVVCDPATTADVSLGTNISTDKPVTSTQ